MEYNTTSRSNAAHAARLDRTVQELQTRVKEQETALEKLRRSSVSKSVELSSDSTAQLHHLRTFKAAYESLTPKQPYLPLPESPLPALLALRSTHMSIKDARVLSGTIQLDLTDMQQQLEQEQAHLNDARLIATGLEARIEYLLADVLARSQQPQTQIAEDIIQDIKNKTARYDIETGKLVKAFNRFVDDHLAAMLAAEDMGGPVVGEMPDLDELSLEAGFNSQGKAKKPKDHSDDGKRQRRIDDLWGQRPPGGRRNDEPWDERRAAGADMRALTEQLLNRLVETEGGTDAYVELEKESAAAKFLIRSKIAQFHPKDSNRLRLIDFGRELDHY